MPAAPPSPPAGALGDRCPGAARLHEAADGYLARVRVPGGLLSVDQVDALVLVATTLGDGALSLTARGNVEIRGLSADAGPPLTDALRSSGLLPSLAHERVRNIVATPAAGLDGLGHAGRLVDTVRDLDRILCSTPRAADLSGRFLIGLDDARGDVLALQPDLTAAWVSPTDAHLYVGPHPVVSLSTPDAPTALVTAAVAFLDTRDAHGETGWRVADLPLPVSTAVRRAVARAVTELLPHARPIEAAGANPGPATDAPETAPIPGPGRLGTDAVHLLLRLGSAPGATWTELGRIARAGDGLLRTTAARGVVLAHLPAPVLTDALERAPRLGLVADDADPYAHVGACTGLPGCASSARDVRRDVAGALDDGATPLLETTTDFLYVSGCPRRCGHPRRPHLEAVARATTTDGGPYALRPADGRPSTGAPLGTRQEDLGTVLTDLTRTGDRS